MFSFNVRVYGLWYHEGRIIVSRESIKGRQIVKFPGGGLEYGEGLKECLKREFLEEMGISVEVAEHFYTTDFFQKSAWDESQVISVYYKVSSDLQWPKLPLDNGQECFYELPINDDLVATLGLPIDKIVGGLLLEEMKKR